MIKIATGKAVFNGGTGDDYFEVLPFSNAGYALIDCSITIESPADFHAANIPLAPNERSAAVAILLCETGIIAARAFTSLQMAKLPTPSAHRTATLVYPTPREPLHGLHARNVYFAITTTDSLFENAAVLSLRYLEL